MSWNLTIDSGTPASEAEERLKAKQTELLKEAAAEVHEQVDAAVAALRALLPVVQPDPVGTVSGFIAGHANPGHTPAEGQPPDSVSVVVSRG